MVKETVELYNYQKEAKDFVLNNIDQTHVLLGAAPNAGKTFIASFIIKELIKKGSRVLCSVHGTNILKRQFYDSICDIVGFENVSIYDTTDLYLYDPGKKVQVMIYQNTKQMEECVEEFGEFDYLVVDEAHKFYEGTNSMATIGDEYVRGNHLLLTGSPAIFKERVDSGEIRAKYISVSLIESVQDGQYDKEIRLDIVSNDVHLTNEDYNSDGEVIQKSYNKLISNEPVLDSLLVGDFGKTIIFTKRTKQADAIENYLDNKRIINFTSHSHSDKDSKNIYEFKNNYTGIDNVVLIVVGRATEGFDDPNISIIDMTYSKNIDTLYQRYSRAIRKRTDAKHKRYVKVVPNNDNSAEIFIHIMTAVLMLIKQEHYEKFNGKNFSIPTLRQYVKSSGGVGVVKSYIEKPHLEITDISYSEIFIKSSETPLSIGELVENENFKVNLEFGSECYEIKSEDYNEWVDKLNGKEYVLNISKSNNTVDDCLLMETKLYSGAFFDINNELYGSITRYATNRLSDVLREIGRDIGEEIYASEQEHIDFIKNNNIKAIPSYTKLYKTSSLKLYSNPWRIHIYGNGSAKDYFGTIYGEKEELASGQEHIDFIKENNITNSPSYSKLYKTSSLKLSCEPWVKLANSTVKDYFESIWGKNEEYASGQEHIDFIKENNITNSDLYSKLYKTSSLKLYSNPYTKYSYGNGSAKDYFESIWDDKFGTQKEHIEFILDNNIKSSVVYRKIYKTSSLNLHSQPWREYAYGNGSANDYFESIYGKKEEYASEQEHIDFIKENNIKSSNSYNNSYKKSSLNLHSSPWCKYGKYSIIDYFETIWDNKLASEKEHIDFILDNSIRSGRSYSKLYNTSSLKLYSTPWIKFGNGCVKDYFETIWDNKLASEKEHLDFIKENNLKSSNSYINLYKTSSLRLSSEPWIKFGNGSIKDYFGSIFGRKEEYASNQEHINYIKDNNIRRWGLYIKLYKTSSLKLYSNPWAKNAYGNGSVKDYFESIWYNKYASEQEHIDFIKDNNIKSNTKYSKLYKTSSLNLLSTPWTKYGLINKSVTDYFESIWGKKEKFASEQEHIDFIKDNNIKSSNSYNNSYKKSSLNLHSSPWCKYGNGNGSIKDYFESIWYDKYASEQEHIDFIKDNNITKSTSYNKLYKTSSLKLYSNPWTKNAYGNGSIKDYFNSIWIDNTKYNKLESLALSKKRNTQNIFRDNLMKRWGGKCAVTKIENPNLLKASHIIPWSDSDDSQKMDTDNGLLLSVRYDNLFDKHLISFDCNGNILISNQISKSDLDKDGITGSEKIYNLSEGNKKYLKVHSSKLK